LIAQSRWREGRVVAARLAARRDASDRELLLAFTERSAITNGDEVPDAPRANFAASRELR
jgi:hypothetical protein